MLLLIETQYIVRRSRTKRGLVTAKIPTRIVHLKCNNCGECFIRPYGRMSVAQRESTYHFCSTCKFYEHAFVKGHNERGHVLRQPFGTIKIGDKKINQQGYVEMFVKRTHPHSYTKRGWSLEHIVIMENYLGRSLHEDEVVHHIDGNKTNNNLTNLVVMTSEQHRLCHNSADLLFYDLVKEGLIKHDFTTRTYVFTEQLHELVGS